jgi:uncharacterized sulfatase
MWLNLFFRICTCCVAVLFVLSETSLRASPPNIVVILADDLGWKDLRYAGNRWHDTPNLDRLAAQGMQFSQAYAAAPICSASRAALLTGRAPARLHYEFVTKNAPGQQKDNHPLQTPAYPNNLPLEETTIAEVLRASGYYCGYYGKWHLNHHYEHYLGWSPTHGPLQQGFSVGDLEFGSHPYSYGKSFKPADVKSGEFPPDALTQKAAAFLREHRERPFLLWLSHYYVHEPFHSRCAWLQEKYRQRLPKDTSTDRIAYAAMVETFDHYVGEFLKVLDDLGLTQNTLVIFTSDNGGHPAVAANGPLRGGKWTLYEGGVRVPLLVRWPGTVQAGSQCDMPVMGTDLFPTLCEIAGGKPDPQRQLDGISFLPALMGKVVAGTKPRLLTWHFPFYHPESGYGRAKPVIGVDDFVGHQVKPHSAMRLDNLKLVHTYEQNENELYDLSKDPSEAHNLVPEQMGNATEMWRKLDESLDTMQARRPVLKAAQRKEQ